MPRSRASKSSKKYKKKKNTTTSIIDQTNKTNTTNGTINSTETNTTSPNSTEIVLTNDALTLKLLENNTSETSNKSNSKNRVLLGKYNSSKSQDTVVSVHTSDTDDQYRFQSESDKDTTFSSYTSASQSHNPYVRLKSEVSSRHSSPRNNRLPNPREIIESNNRASSSYIGSVDFEEAKERSERKLKYKEEQLLRAKYNENLSTNIVKQYFATLLARNLGDLSLENGNNFNAVYDSLPETYTNKDIDEIKDSARELSDKQIPVNTLKSKLSWQSQRIVESYGEDFLKTLESERKNKLKTQANNKYISETLDKLEKNKSEKAVGVGKTVKLDKFGKELDRNLNIQEDSTEAEEEEEENRQTSSEEDPDTFETLDYRQKSTFKPLPQSGEVASESTSLAVDKVETNSGNDTGNTDSQMASNKNSNATLPPAPACTIKRMTGRSSGNQPSTNNYTADNYGLNNDGYGFNTGNTYNSGQGLHSAHPFTNGELSRNTLSSSQNFYSGANNDIYSGLESELVNLSSIADRASSAVEDFSQGSSLTMPHAGRQFMINTDSSTSLLKKQENLLNKQNGHLNKTGLGTKQPVGAWYSEREEANREIKEYSANKLKTSESMYLEDYTPSSFQKQPLLHSNFDDEDDETAPYNATTSSHKNKVVLLSSPEKSEKQPIEKTVPLFNESSTVKHNYGTELTDFSKTGPTSISGNSDFRNKQYASARANNMYKNASTTSKPPNTGLRHYQAELRRKSNLGGHDPTVIIHETVGSKPMLNRHSLENVRFSNPTGYNSLAATNIGSTNLGSTGLRSAGLRSTDLPATNISAKKSVVDNSLTDSQKIMELQKPQNSKNLNDGEVKTAEDQNGENQSETTANKKKKKKKKKKSGNADGTEDTKNADSKNADSTQPNPSTILSTGSSFTNGSKLFGSRHTIHDNDSLINLHTGDQSKWGNTLTNRRSLNSPPEIGAKFHIDAHSQSLKLGIKPTTENSTKLTEKEVENNKTDKNSQSKKPKKRTIKEFKKEKEEEKRQQEVQASINRQKNFGLENSSYYAPMYTGGLSGPPGMRSYGGNPQDFYTGHEMKLGARMQQGENGDFIRTNMESTPLAEFQGNGISGFPNYGSTLTQRSIMNDPKGKSRLFLNDNKTDKTERKKSDKTEEEEKRVNENDIKKELEERGIVIEDWMLDDDDKPEKSGKKKKKGGKKSKGGKNDKNGATPTSSLTNIGDGSKSEGRTDGGKVKKDGKNNNAKRSGNTTNTDDTQSVHSSTATPNTTQNIDSDVVESEIDSYLRESTEKTPLLIAKRDGNWSTPPGMVDYSSSEDDDQVYAQSEDAEDATLDSKTLENEDFVEEPTITNEVGKDEVAVNEAGKDEVISNDGKQRTESPNSKNGERRDTKKPEIKLENKNSKSESNKPEANKPEIRKPEIKKSEMNKPEFNKLENKQSENKNKSSSQKAAKTTIPEPETLEFQVVASKSSRKHNKDPKNSQHMPSKHQKHQQPHPSSSSSQTVPGNNSSSVSGPTHPNSSQPDKYKLNFQANIKQTSNTITNNNNSANTNTANNTSVDSSNLLSSLGKQNFPPPGLAPLSQPTTASDTQKNQSNGNSVWGANKESVSKEIGSSSNKDSSNKDISNKDSFNKNSSKIAAPQPFSWASKLRPNTKQVPTKSSKTSNVTSPVNTTANAQVNAPTNSTSTQAATSNNASSQSKQDKNSNHELNKSATATKLAPTLSSKLADKKPTGLNIKLPESTIIKQSSQKPESRSSKTNNNPSISSSTTIPQTVTQTTLQITPSATTNSSQPNSSHSTVVSNFLSSPSVQHEIASSTPRSQFSDVTSADTSTSDDDLCVVIEQDKIKKSAERAVPANSKLGNHIPGVNYFQPPPHLQNPDLAKSDSSLQNRVPSFTRRNVNVGSNQSFMPFEEDKENGTEFENNTQIEVGQVMSKSFEEDKTVLEENDSSVKEEITETTVIEVESAEITPIKSSNNSNIPSSMYNVVVEAKSENVDKSGFDSDLSDDDFEKIAGEGWTDNEVELVKRKISKNNSRTHSKNNSKNNSKTDSKPNSTSNSIDIQLPAVKKQSIEDWADAVEDSDSIQALESEDEEELNRAFEDENANNGDISEDCMDYLVENEDHEEEARKEEAQELSEVLQSVFCSPENTFQLNFFVPEVKVSDTSYTQNCTTEPAQFRITPSKSFTTRGLYRFLKKCEKLSTDKKGPTQSYGFNSSIEYVDSEFQKVSKTAKKFSLD